MRCSSSPERRRSRRRFAVLKVLQICHPTLRTFGAWFTRILPAASCLVLTSSHQMCSSQAKLSQIGLLYVRVSGRPRLAQERYHRSHDSAVAYIPHARYTFIRMYVGLFYNHSLLTPVWSNVLMLLFICLSSSHYLEEVLLAFRPMILRHGSASSLASTLVVPAPLASFVF